MSKRHYAHVLSLLSFIVLLPCLSGMLYGETLPERCLLEPVNGSCKAMMEKYYFDRKTGRCEKYIYDGCGPIVPFDVLEECRALCETEKSDGNQVKMPELKPDDKKRSGLKYDPVEDDPRYVDIFKTIDVEVKELLATHAQRGSEGFVNIYWETKKRLLKRKYDIDWRSPGELNPHVLFD